MNISLFKNRSGKGRALLVEFLIGLVFLCTTSLTFSQELNVLVIGSTHSFSEGGESGVVHERPFNSAGIATQLQGILAQDPAITETVNVEFEDIYKTKLQTVIYSANNPNDFTSHCYSLAQHYLWPDGKAARLANLRGEGTRVWDYIVLCNDPYITANFPGMVAEGVKLIREEVAKSANPAQIVLLAQWPESSSAFTANQLNEIAHRVGNSAGLTAVPAGKAWDSYGSKDTSSNHPTPRGEYLAAASIYSKLFNRSASTSAYDFPSVGDAIADHSLSVVQANVGMAQYSGTYTSFNPFQMKYLSKRVVSYRETGTSTEDRIAQALDRLDDVQRITFNTTGYAGVPGTRWDFNYGRGNDWWEPEKQYDVNSTIYDWVYGFPMHHYSTTSAPMTMPYGVDKHYSTLYGYEDGTDLGIPYNMIRPGTREPDLPEAVRAIPIRLMWLKMCEMSPGFNPLGDSTHMHPHLNDASAAFMYTLLSGRCPVVAEPAPSGSTAWMQWLGHKIGYETAWQMSHLTTRAPGFRVLPSATAATTVTPTTTETMTVEFAYPPQANVTVTVSSSSPTAVIASPKTLVFTPSNYSTPQQVKVAGIPGATASPTFNVNFSTSSSDEIYNSLSDSWAYTNNRSATAGLTQVDNGSIPVVVEQYTAEVINLGVAAANAGNTIFAGPLHGSIIWQGNGVIQYTPVTGYTGTDQIVFAVTIGTTQTIGNIDISVQIPEGQVSANATDASASEQGPDTGTFVISRLGETSSPVNVLFSMSGAATPGTDYTLSHASPVTIPAGQSSVTLTLTPVDDAVVGEGTETAILNITPDAAYPIGLASANITIADNDNTVPVVNAGADQTATLSEGSPWSPAEISTQLWLDATDAATIGLNGAAVSQWNDKSGNNRHASQTTAASQPALTAAGLNGKDVLTFDGNSDFLNLGTGLDFLSGTSHSAFIVVANLATYSNLYGAATANSGSGSLHAGFSNSSTYRMNYWGHDYTTAVTANFTNTGSILNYVWPVGSPRQILANGKLEGSSSGNALAPGAMAGGGRIGNIVGQGYIGGKIAEMVFLTGIVPQADRERMEGYLAHKWGMSANLAIDHPYKSQSPGGASALATLDATVTDADGQTPTTLWTKISGPGTVTFANATAIDTTATFTVAGVYTLRLTANDGFGAVSDDIVITINAAASTHTVTYNGNGSTGGSAPVDVSSPYPSGNTVTVLGNTGSLVRSGFTFNNWNTVANGSGTSYAPGNTFTINSATTLFAQWTAVPTYTITYIGNGNTGGSAPSGQIKTQGLSLSLSGAGTLVRTGFAFSNWNTVADGSGASYVAGATYSADADLTLHAQWTALPAYTITYDGNGNTGGTAPANQTKIHDTNLTLAGAGDLVRTGYVFNGWNTAANGTGTNYPAVSTYSANAPLSLFANWVLNNFLTWDANAASANLTDGAGAWLNANQWWNSSTNTTWSSPTHVVFGNGGTGGAVTLASPTTVNQITFNTFNGTYTLGTTGQALTINDGINKTATSGIVSIISPITLGGPQTWTNHSPNSLAVSGAVDNGGHLLSFDGTGPISLTTALAAGGGGITKNGVGRLQLSNAAQLYTGPTIVNGGVLSYGDTSAQLSAANIILNGGLIDQRWTTIFTRALGPGGNHIQLTGGASGFSNNNGNHTVRINNSILTEVVWGAANEAGNMNATGFFNPSTFVLQSAFTQNNSTLTFDNPIDLNASTRTIEVNPGIGGASVGLLAQAIRTSSGTAGMIKTGGGILILNGTNTYNGGTTISGGTLRIGNNSAGTLGSGNYAGSISIATGATLQIWSSAAQTLNGTLSGGGGLHKAYGGALTLSGPNTYTGRTSFLPQTTAGFTVNITSFNSVNGGTPLMASSSLGAPSTLANGTIDIGDTGKQAGVNLSYTGPGETTDRVINFGFNGSASQTLTASGSGLLKFTSAMTSNTITTQSGKLILAGTGSGEITQALPALPSGGLTKNDGGTWTLGGANSYTGPTAITGGKLFINGNQSTATGNVSVAASATLGGTGTIGGNTTIDTNGRLEFNLSTPAAGHDQLDLASGDTLTFSGTSVLNITSTSGAAPGIYTLLTAPGGITGSAPTTLNLPSSWAATVSKVGNDLVLNVTSTGVVTDPFAVWAVGGVVFNTDTNGDGVRNGLAWLLGAANPSENALSRLPLVSRTGGNLRLTFRCLKSTKRGTAQLKVQSSSDLGVPDPWTNHEAAVPDADSTVNGVVFDTTDDGDFINVIADIPAAGTKLFGRLQATP